MYTHEIAYSYIGLSSCLLSTAEMRSDDATAAIAGGVVGGLVGFVLIAVIVIVIVIYCQEQARVV